MPKWGGKEYKPGKQTGKEAGPSRRVRETGAGDSGSGTRESMARRCRQLSVEERVEIETLAAEWRSGQSIARCRGSTLSTISREPRRNREGDQPKWCPNRTSRCNFPVYW